jgi:transcription-repair coupling factor (superfamily II helicase)
VFEPHARARARGHEDAYAAQAYCVVPRIADIEAVHAMVLGAAPDARVVTAHGELADLEQRLLSFANRGADILVCPAPFARGPRLPARSLCVTSGALEEGAQCPV